MMRKILSLILSLSLFFQCSGFAQSINLADYLNQTPHAIALDRFRPLSLRYFSYEPATDGFKILLDKGDQKNLSDIKIKDEADKLLTYFKIGLTLTNEKFWVNLRPDYADQIIDPELEKTDLGKVLLEADLQLKKDTSSLTSPQAREGKTYWDKLYKKAGELFGTENITIPTLTRPWIVPGEIILRESADSANNASGAYIYKANLKVMLEEDYLKNSTNSINSNNATNYSFTDPRLKELNQYSTQLIRELILPKLTQKVNSSKDYANLRQVYFSLILARWFKETFNSQPTANSSQNNDSYIKLIDSHNLINLTSKQAWDKTDYFKAYQKSFQEGEYNLSQTLHTPTGQVIRRYMSGGTTFEAMSKAGYTVKEKTVASAIESKGKVLLSNDKLDIQKLTFIHNEEPTQKMAASAIEAEAEIDQRERGKAKERFTSAQKKTEKTLKEFKKIDWEKQITEKHTFSYYSPEDAKAEISSMGPEGERLVKKALHAYGKIKNGEVLPMDERVTSKDREFLENLLGGKGAHLIEMALLGFRVPRGFTTTTRATERYYDIKQMEEAIDELRGLSKEASIKIDTQFDNDLKQAETIISRYRDRIDQEEARALGRLEKLEGKTLGDKNDPLLISVRSGGAKSMPGMMDTVLNLGLWGEAVNGFGKQEGGELFAFDTYRRFLNMFGSIVLGIPKEEYNDIMTAKKKEFASRKGIDLTGVSDINKAVKDTDLELQDLKDLCDAFNALAEKKTGKAFPQNPEEQRKLARAAVMESSTGARAMKYRAINKIPLKGTISAVNYVTMKYGNRGATSGTGVIFTRDPNTGKIVFEPGSSERTVYGEFLAQAQGEDVVAGTRTPLSAIDMKENFLVPYNELRSGALLLEKYYGDMQDIEFTIDGNILYFLQARKGKRTARAEVTIGVDQVQERGITINEAILRFKDDASRLVELFFPQFDPEVLEAVRKGDREEKIIGKGLPAGPGATVGRAFFNQKDAVRAMEEAKAKYKAAEKRGATQDELKQIASEQQIILVRRETSPDDIAGMEVSLGILTSRGGMTSHAAVVGRGMGKTVVVGANISIEEEHQQFIGLNGVVVKNGDWFSLNGSTGEIISGRLPTIPSIVIRGIDQARGIELKEQEKLTMEELDFFDKFDVFYQWVRDRKGIGVRANAEQRKDIARALSFYAQGIGLARTEHMFFDVEGQERLIHMQAMILADTTAEREKPLNKLTGFQQSDWENIFRQENGEAVTIRLLDPPLHEFLPKKTDKSYEERIALLMEMTGKTRKQIEDKIKELEEENPMLGHRGNRLLASFPEIARAQLTAAFNAAKAVEKEGIKVNMEIMTALISNLPEFLRAKKQIEDVGAELGYAREKYKIGTMIELVNAALLADKIAPHAEFLSFGTNDLTQTLFGFSREDMGRTVGPTYVEKKFLNNEPFTVLDETTWLLVGIAIQKARKANPKIKIGVCGEHGGDPVSVQRFRQAGVDYVSCSAYRVPVAYLQSAIDAILVKEGKPLPNPPEFKLFAEEEAMPAPREIRLIDGIKYAHSTQKAVVEAVIRVNNKEISKEEAIGSLNLNLIKNYFNSPEGFPVWFVESSEFQKILEWAQEIKTLGIEVLVKNKEEINGLAVSRAEGITVQTEDTFLYNNIEAARRLIFAHTDDTRKKAMLDLASSQYDFFEALFDAKNLKGRKVTIKLLDASLKSFIQGLTEKEIDKLTGDLSIDKDKIHKDIAKYSELNPAFGNKGSRLALTFHPDLYKAQLMAIFLAGIRKEVNTEINIAVPFLIEAKEFIAMKELIEEAANQVKKETNTKELKFNIIPEIATPRAALSAEQFAPEAEAVVIDASTLTNGVLGMTREDSKTFLPDYIRKGIYPQDPYKAIYEEGVGLLLREGIVRLRRENPNLKVSVWGYGNDSASIEFYQRAGVDTVSVANLNEVDIATLAAAQAAIKYPGRGASSSLNEAGKVFSIGKVVVIGKKLAGEATRLKEAYAELSKRSPDVKFPRLEPIVVESIGDENIQTADMIITDADTAGKIEKDFSIILGSGEGTVVLQRKKGVSSSPVPRRPTYVAINGFGEIGSDFVRAELQSSDDHVIVGINELGFNIGKEETEERAAIGKFINKLQNDFKTKPRSWLGDVEVSYEKDNDGYWMIIGKKDGDNWIALNNGQRIKLISNPDPSKLPWSELKVDTVIESTGVFITKEKAAKHLEGGAKKVIISAPGKGAGIISITPGASGKVEDFVSENLIYDCASCTTNSLAATVKELVDHIGIESYALTTIHAYTRNQSALDDGFIIEATGAALALQKIIPELKGKGTGRAVRGPVTNGSLSDFTFYASRDTTVEEVNDILKKTAEGHLKGILGYKKGGEKKSGEILGTTESGILQADETTVSGGRLVNVKIWYDNVFSYTNRLVDLVSLLNSSKVKEEDDGIRKRERPPAIEGGLIAKEIFYLEQERKELENAIQENPADRKKETFDKIVDIKLQISRLREKLLKLSGESTVSSPFNSQIPETKGGIDLRQMNMLIQPQGSFASSSLDFSLPALSKAEIESFDLDTELAAIQKMASSGIAPSDERLKEYLAVCFARQKTGREIDSLKLCLLDVFEQQQLEAKETPNGYKEVLVIADTRGYVLKEGRLAASKQNSYSLN